MIYFSNAQVSKIQDRASHRSIKARTVLAEHSFLILLRVGARISRIPKRKESQGALVLVSNKGTQGPGRMRDELN